MYFELLPCRNHIPKGALHGEEELSAPAADLGVRLVARLQILCHLFQGQEGWFCTTFNVIVSSVDFAPSYPVLLSKSQAKNSRNLVPALLAEPCSS